MIDGTQVDRMVAIMAAEGEPTEFEAIYWRVEGPFTDGWVARVMWDHHDGEIELGKGDGPTLDEAITAAVTNWKG